MNPTKKISLWVILFMGIWWVAQSEATERKICDQGKSVLAADEGWTLEKNEDGIKVYLRTTPISPIKIFRGVAEFDVEFSRMVALIWDGDAYVDWLLLCEKAETLKEVSDTEQYLYTVNNPMWPVKKRDSVCHRTISQDSETLAVTIQMCLAPDYLPEKEGIIRLPLLMGYGKITPLPSGKTEVIYEVLVDVGGWVPTWIINFYQANTAFITFQNLKKMLPLDNYKDVRYGFLKYPDSQKYASSTPVGNAIKK